MTHRFRTWNIQENSYEVQDNCILNGDGTLSIWDEAHGRHFVVDPDLYEIEHDTGILDINKKPIYKNDICKSNKSFQNKLTQIVYVAGSFRHRFTDTKASHSISQNWADLERLYD